MDLKLVDDVTYINQHCKSSEILYSFFEDQYHIQGEKFLKYEELSKKIADLYNKWYGIESIYRMISIKDRTLFFNRKLILFETGDKDIYVQVTKEADWQLKQLAGLFSSDDNILRMSIFETLDFGLIKREEDTELVNLMLTRYKLILEQLEYMKNEMEQYFYKKYGVIKL